MKYPFLTVLTGIALIVAGHVAARAEETSGRVADTAYGSFKLEEQGTLRQFNVSSKKTAYTPALWRPAIGDVVKVVYTPSQNKRGTTVLAVDTLTLVKPGPETVPDLTSPVVVEIVESGVSGVKARLPKGQVLKFNLGRKTKRVPAGWIIAAGEKARIVFQIKPNRFSGGVMYAVDEIEKVP